MNLKGKRSINKIGKLVIDKDKGKLCYLDLNKLEKEKKLISNSKVMKVILPDVYADIDNITYIFKDYNFKEKLDVIAYNTPNKKLFHIEFENCSFEDDVSILANNVKMTNNSYLDSCVHDDLHHHNLEIQGDHIVFDNEHHNSSCWDVNVFSYEGVENTVKFIDSTLKFKDISLWTDEMMYLNNEKEYKIEFSNSNLKPDKRSLLQADFSQMIIKNSIFSKNTDIKLKNINNIDPDNFSLILNNAKINSIRADIEADTILLANNSYIDSPDIKIIANYTTFSTASKIHGFNVIMDSTFCITGTNSGNIQADNGIYIKTETSINSLSIYSPTIIYNDHKIQNSTATDTSFYDYLVSFNSDLRAEEKEKVNTKKI